jgi:ABC-type siderophore export system fused ATPase/permease subunit
MVGDSLEGPLYVEIAKVWEEAFCMITTDGVDKIFQAFKKVRVDVPASKSNKSNQILLEVGKNIYRLSPAYLIAIYILITYIIAICTSIYLIYLSIYQSIFL